MPNYIFASGTTFYFLSSIPEDGDFVHASYAACHREHFGHVAGDPCPPGGSYSATETPGLYAKAG